MLHTHFGSCSLEFPSPSAFLSSVSLCLCHSPGSSGLFRPLTMGNSFNCPLHFEFTEFSTTSCQLSDALIDLHNVFSHAFPSFSFFLRSFIWLYWILVVAHKIFDLCYSLEDFSCGMWVLVPCVCGSHSSYPSLCDPMNCSPPGSSVHGILQARILEWVAFPFSRGSSLFRD